MLKDSRAKKPDTEIFINGPINTIRVEGMVGTEKKILYLFCDFHEHINEQTKCPTIRNIDISNYLSEIFLNDANDPNSDIKDFFLEIQNKYYTDTKLNIDKKIYIMQLFDFFIKSFKIDPKKNKVMMSDVFKKTRFHLLDIRDFFFISNYPRNLKQNFNQHIKNKSTLNSQYLNLIKNDLNLIKKQTIFFYDSLVNGEKIQNQDVIEPSYENKYYKIVDKIRNKYSHPEIKIIINNIIENEVKSYFRDALKIIEDIFIYINDFEEKNKNTNLDSFRTLSLNNDKYDPYYYYPNSREIEIFIFDIENYLSNLILVTINIGTIITDIYFIRRYIDKNYVKKGIVYTGLAHSINYLYILVKYFDFKVTDADYLNKDIQNVEQEIKKINDPQRIGFIFTPPYLLQCSNLSNFPSNFE